MCLFCGQYSSEEEEEDLNATAAGIANKQKKELAKVDHSNMQYTPFRKNFYVEVPEIARMTPEEVDAYKEVQQTVAIITQSYLVRFISDHFLPQILRRKPGCLGVRHRFLSPRSWDATGWIHCSYFRYLLLLLFMTKIEV